MKEAGKEWLLAGVGFLMIAVAIFGTMWGSVGDVNDRMNTQITGTNLPTQP
jgi:hypothetical protein